MPVLALVTLGSAAAGAAPASWLGQKVDPAGTAFCRTHGCTLVEVRRNGEGTMGWHDGTRRSYRLKDGSRVEVDVRPQGWISNAFLFTGGQPQPGGMSVMNPAHYPLAAEFLSAVTGRRFSAEKIAAYQRAGAALNNPEAYGPTAPLSHWTTPGGLPYKARCGINSQVGVWAGWRQA
ncbi:hypothetical protein GCM10017783_20590 [Deinococcus piscis]|uniref:Uncharacterized protein n=1 Tax=Deinococcus piscis TaxID=394230 RepID=A0ABQ3K815_9DEIO|nr:hypothetical protein GCM10017783_20590 [Deinococcus piscis]